MGKRHRPSGLDVLFWILYATAWNLVLGADRLHAVVPAEEIPSTAPSFSLTLALVLLAAGAGGALGSWLRIGRLKVMALLLTLLVIGGGTYSIVASPAPRLFVLHRAGGSEEILEEGLRTLSGGRLAIVYSAEPETDACVAFELGENPSCDFPQMKSNLAGVPQNWTIGEIVLSEIHTQARFCAEVEDRFLKERYQVRGVVYPLDGFWRLNIHYSWEDTEASFAVWVAAASVIASTILGYLVEKKLKK